MTSEEIQAIFFVECEESLAAAEGSLEVCRAGLQDGETINTIFRAIHSIKGGAGAFGYVALQGFAHAFEALLSDVRDGQVPVEAELVGLLLRALDVLCDHVTAAREGGSPPADAELLGQLGAAQAGGEPHAPKAETAEIRAVEEPSTSGDCDLDLDLDALLDDLLGPPTEDLDPPWTLQVRPLAGAMANGSEPVLLLAELLRLGAHDVRCDASAVPLLDGFDPEEAYLAWTLAMPAAVGRDTVREIFDFVGDDCPITCIDAAAPSPDELLSAAPAADAEVASPAPSAASGPSRPGAVGTESAATSATAGRGSQTVRIDLAKLDRLIDGVGELVIAQAMMAQRLEGSGLNGIEELALLESLTRDIQESAMSIRAQPIGSVFSRVPRMLRELEASTGKRVDLVVAGESTELDKTVVERLGEPLTHLIRNAVDHGVEDAEARLRAGKPPAGTLSLSAEQRSGRIIIKIADDGRGIDRERVFAKAVDKGLIAADAQLSDEEIDNLIFAPGFSTAETVSNISGRGVGMDVVRQNVKDLGGRISIESRPGAGTTFTLALPLTLAISDGMIVTVGDQTLVVPLAHVVESLRPGADDVQAMGSDRRLLNVRGKFIPVVPLDSAIGAREAIVDPLQGVLIVVDTESAGQAALLVDSICDQRQFVIKSLDTHFRPVSGVAGATILGDGRVALIIDVDGLVAGAMATSRLREAA